jgi:hypothetical protein
MENFYILMQVVLVNKALRGVFMVHLYISVKCLKNSDHMVTYL